MVHTLVNKKRKGLSPLLATVILIGITVAAGGVVYTVYTGSAGAAGTGNAIRVDSVTAVKGSNHADFSVTVSNVGSTPWEELEIWIAKETASRPILYEIVHEVASGTTGGEDSHENPLRPEAIALSDDGVGLGLGRKFQLKQEDSFPATRTVAVDTRAVDKMDNGVIDNSADGGGVLDCTEAQFDEIDASWDGDGTVGSAAAGLETCTVQYGQALSKPIAPGESMRVYADLLLKDSLDLHPTTGLDTRTAESKHPISVEVGDEMVVNIKAVTIDGSEIQTQTVVKVISA